MKLAKGDTILITAGRDKGRTGQIERVYPQDETVLVPGINQYKRHRKPMGQDRPGEIVTLSRPLQMGNVALMCPRCKQQTRVGYREVSGKKVRVCRKCDQEISLVDIKADSKSAKSKKGKK